MDSCYSYHCSCRLIYDCWKPIIALNGSITHLQDAIDELREDIKVLTGRTDSQEEKLQDHETRISILEENKRKRIRNKKCGNHQN